MVKSYQAILHSLNLNVKNNNKRLRNNGSPDKGKQSHGCSITYRKETIDYCENTDYIMIILEEGMHYNEHAFEMTWRLDRGTVPYRMGFV